MTDMTVYLMHKLWHWSKSMSVACLCHLQFSVSMTSIWRTNAQLPATIVHLSRKENELCRCSEPILKDHVLSVQNLNKKKIILTDRQVPVIKHPNAYGSVSRTYFFPQICCRDHTTFGYSLNVKEVLGDTFLLPWKCLAHLSKLLQRFQWFKRSFGMLLTQQHAWSSVEPPF